MAPASTPSFAAPPFRGALSTFLHHPVGQRLLFFLVLLAVCLPIYAPALDRFFAADQIIYFADLRNDTSLAAGLQRWDYSNSRIYNRGDELLYRPLLFTGLALENTFFGYNYRAWNLTCLLLHFLVVWILYEFLRFLHPSIFAAAFALLFAVFAADVELVMWNHLSGYLLGYALILAALFAARRAAVAPSPNRALLAYAVIITLAMGFYEMAVVTAVLAPLYLWFSLREKPAFRFRPLFFASVVPLCCFGIPYLAHLFNGRHLLFTITHPANEQTPLIIRAASLPGTWFLRLLNPWYVEYALRPLYRFIVVHVGNIDVLAQTTFVFTLLAVLGLFCLKPHPPFSPGTRRFAALLVTLLAIYTVLNSVGRDYAENNTYYVYFFALLGVVLLYSFLDFSRSTRLAQTLALAILVVFIAANAVRTLEISRDVQASTQEPNRYFDHIQAFVDQHRNEPGFSFAILDTPKKTDPTTKVWLGYSYSSKPIILPYSALMYLRYYDPMHPKYVLNNGQVPALRAPDAPLLPALPAPRNS